MIRPPQPSVAPRIGLRCPLTGKTIYPTEEQAQARLDEGLRCIDGSGHVPVRVYRCPVCEGFHLTHHVRRGGRL